MTLFLAMLLFAQVRQIERAPELQLFPCPAHESPWVGRALPESTICWQHVQPGLYEVAPGSWLPYGVDGYRVFEDAIFRADLPAMESHWVNEDGSIHIYWQAVTTFSPLKLTGFAYQPGASHTWCVQSYTWDIWPRTEATFSRATCLKVEWEYHCPPRFSGDDGECRLMVIP